MFEALKIYMEYLTKALKLKYSPSYWCVQTQSYEGFWHNKFDKRWDKEVPKLETHYLNIDTKIFTFEEFIKPHHEKHYCPDRVESFIPMERFLNQIP